MKIEYVEIDPKTIEVYCIRIFTSNHKSYLYSRDYKSKSYARKTFIEKSNKYKGNLAEVAIKIKGMWHHCLIKNDEFVETGKILVNKRAVF